MRSLLHFIHPIFSSCDSYSCRIRPHWGIQCINTWWSKLNETSCCPTCITAFSVAISCLATNRASIWLDGNIAAVCFVGVNDVEGTIIVAADDDVNFALFTHLAIDVDIQCICNTNHGSVITDQATENTYHFCLLSSAWFCFSYYSALNI